MNHLFKILNYICSAIFLLNISCVFSAEPNPSKIQMRELQGAIGLLKDSAPKIAKKDDAAAYVWEMVSLHRQPNRICAYDILGTGAIDNVIVSVGIRPNVPVLMSESFTIVSETILAMNGGRSSNAVNNLVTNSLGKSLTAKLDQITIDFKFTPEIDGAVGSGIWTVDIQVTD